jgi:hypothetical protein
MESEEGKEMEGKQCEKLHFWGGGSNISALELVICRERSSFWVKVCWRKGKALGSEGGKAIAVDALLNNI